MIRIRPLFALLAIVAALSVAAVDADARSSGSSGSRGSRTFSTPAPTATAPRATQPIQRTITQPNQTAGSTFGQQTRSGGLFGGGLLGGLAAGFIGAGLFGMLFGHGFLGGVGGFASILGLLIQIALVVIVARLAWAWWQSRNQAATANGPSMRQNMLGSNEPPRGFGGFGGFGGGASQAPLEIKPEDFDAFEQLLGQVQTAYGNEDIATLRAHVTPEMLSYFSEEFSRNASQGVINQLANIKLLQGDLSESWREGDDEYATVAMRYSLDDKIVDRNSGRVVQIEPSEATELWTFRRVRGGQWVLSAIQQTA